MKEINGTKYTTFDDLWDTGTLKDVEKEIIGLKVQLMGMLIEARERLGLSQQELAQLCGVKQPFIARMEKGETDHQLSTVLKIIKPLGYKIAIVQDDHPSDSLDHVQV